MRHASTIPRCPRCVLPPDRCLCSRLPRLRPPLPIHVVRHWKEARKTSGSVALLQACLDGVTVHDYGGQGVIFDAKPLLIPGAVLLHPPDPEAPPVAFPAEPTQLVVLDGTWGQARRLAQRVPGLQSLPRFSLDSPARSALRLRQTHADWARSTFEAVAEALARLGAPALEAPLFAAYDDWVATSWTLRGNAPPADGR